MLLLPALWSGHCLSKVLRTATSVYRYAGIYLDYVTIVVIVVAVVRKFQILRTFCLLSSMLFLYVIWFAYSLFVWFVVVFLIIYLVCCGLRFDKSLFVL